jgi:hypothetical protein
MQRRLAQPRQLSGIETLISAGKKSLECDPLRAGPLSPAITSSLSTTSKIVFPRIHMSQPTRPPALHSHSAISPRSKSSSRCYAWDCARISIFWYYTYGYNFQQFSRESPLRKTPTQRPPSDQRPVSSFSTISSNIVEIFDRKWRCKSCSIKRKGERMRDG